ncbi:MAG: hypothetical protein ABIT37_13060 [Luteolibacter sp.]
MSIILENDRLSLTIEPAAGGKISSLRNQRTGREWLWQNPHIAIEAKPYGTSYVEQLDSGGWDEIFPSVGPCQPDGWTIPDHGDLVSLPWAVISVTADRVEMSVDTRFADCRFSRVLHLDGNTLRAAYRLQNKSAEKVPYLWCAHPLIAIEPGMQIVLPEGVSMRLDGGVNVPTVEPFSWPALPGLTNIDMIPDVNAPDFKPFAAKMFTAAGAVAAVALRTADGAESLRLNWDRKDAPFLGLWLNCRAWSGCGSAPYFNLGVEPATAPFDLLTDALAAGSGRWLGAGAVREWEMTMCIE